MSLIPKCSFGINDIRRLYALARLEGLVDRLASLEVLDANAVERLSLAGFDEFVLDNDAGIVVDNDLEPGTELVSAVICHNPE